MSQDLYPLLRERAALRGMGLPLGLALSGAVHLAAVGGIWALSLRPGVKQEEVKVTWINLPASGGKIGGESPLEEGKTGQRIRRTEEVAPKHDEKAGQAKQADLTGTKLARPVAKGTSQDQSSRGTSPLASKGANPVKNPVSGATGKGGGGGIGEGTGGYPGLPATNGVGGGSGQIGIEGDFPFSYWPRAVQERVTYNWNRISSAQGRVQIFFRVNRDGRIDGLRVEVPSGNRALDESALLAVKRSDPVMRLPDGFEGDAIGVRFWFTYLGN
ncbi:MAG: TonB family protein [Acidobacteria bacterium]|nr:TonB family protein [Acidobacteriota bacterium]